MIINIDDTQKLKRVIIEFSDNEEIEVLDKSSKSDDKSKSDTKLDETKYNDNTNQILNFNNSEETKISQEIIEKPIIPEKKREPKVSNNMQNLEI